MQEQFSPRTTSTPLTRARVIVTRLRLPWRVWAKIAGGIIAAFIIAGLNFPNPATNWVLIAVVIAWVSAYVAWHIRR